MALKTIKLLTAAAALALTGVASAGTSMFTMVSGVIDSDIDVSLTIQASTQPGYDYDFVVSNAGVGTVTGVYFEEDWTTKLSGAGHATGPADMDPASLNPYVDGWDGPMASHTVGTHRVREYRGPRSYVDVYYDNLDDGIAPGETQTFSFVTDTTIVSLADLMAALGQPGFGVAIRMQDLISDRYAAGWGVAEPINEPQQGQAPAPVTGVPSPTAAFAGIALLGLTSMRRRRN